MLSIDRIIELKGVIKWSAVFAAAGLNPNTMRGAVHLQRELRVEEATAILTVLEAYGLTLAKEREPRLSDDTCTRHLADSHE